jgi:hypothetical protein
MISKIELQFNINYKKDILFEDLRVIGVRF